MSWTRSGAMDRGYMWFAINNADVDYIDLSRKLADSIKRHNKHNKVCIVTNQPVRDEIFDHVRVLKQDDSAEEQWKLSNEYKAFKLSPFTHTIKLEADMLFTQNTDYWWQHLWQHDMVFSYHCRNYRDEIIKDSYYRRLFSRNDLPDVYNGLHFFRRSQRAKIFYEICEVITKNWSQVRSQILVNCHDRQPTTDVVYALANKIQDPLQLHRIEFDWFKFMHNKQHINGINTAFDNDNYLMPMNMDDRLYIGGHRQCRIVHYHNKELRI
jgi:hypothetical protein